MLRQSSSPHRSNDIMPAASNHASHRVRRLGMAVATSLVSKTGSIVLQIIAIPVAVRVLGFEMFGVYAALTTAWACVSLTGIGVGPGLTKAIARAHAAGDRGSEQMYFTTALFLLTAAGLFAGGVVYSVFAYVPGAILFGAQFAPHQAIINTCAPMLAAFIAAETLLSVVERTQAGYQEMHRANLWGASGNLVGGVLLLTGIHHFPTVPFLIIAVIGMQLMSRAGNAIQMIGWHRRYLLAHPFVFCSSKARELISDGLAFTAAQSVAPLLMREGCKLLASHLGGPAAAGVYAVLNQIGTFIGGFIFMVTAPVWPALMDAAARHDYLWFNKTRRRLWTALFAYVGTAGIVLTLFGSWIIERWLGGHVHISTAVLFAYSCYYILSSWEHVNYVCLTGLGALVSPGIIILAEAVSALFAGWLGMQRAGIEGLLWGVCLVMAVMSAWWFPYLLLHRMRVWKNVSTISLSESVVNV